VAAQVHKEARLARFKEEEEGAEDGEENDDAQDQDDLAAPAFPERLKCRYPEEVH
jgi:hypothetical protein